MSLSKSASSDVNRDTEGSGVRLNVSDAFGPSFGPAESKASFSVITYNCEGLMSALPFVGDLLSNHELN